MMHIHTRQIVVALVILFVLGLSFTLQRSGFFSNNEETVHVDHLEGMLPPVKEIPIEEFIEMTAQTPEEVAELREMYGI